jgi:hypothetical protein
MMVSKDSLVLAAILRCGLTNICAIDKTEEVEQRNGWDNVQIDLQTQPALRLGVKRDK